MSAQTERGAVDVLASADAVAHAAAELFASAAERAQQRSGRFTVALSGGSTPRALYERLAQPPFAARIDWPRVHVFFGDERCVPPEHAESNYAMAKRALLDRVPLRPEHVQRMRGEDEPHGAALAYERELRRAFDTPAGPPRPRPGGHVDLCLLGLGRDGHTASLFPGSPALRERERWVAAVPAPPGSASAQRLTLTPPLLRASDEIVFLVCGSDKAAVLRQVLHGPDQPDALPAQIVSGKGAPARWLVDADAAADLPVPARRDSR